MRLHHGSAVVFISFVLQSLLSWVLCAGCQLIPPLVFYSSLIPWCPTFCLSDMTNSRDIKVGEICNKLCDLILDGKPELRDIYSIGGCAGAARKEVSMYVFCVWHEVLHVHLR